MKGLLSGILFLVLIAGFMLVFYNGLTGRVVSEDGVVVSYSDGSFVSCDDSDAPGTLEEQSKISGRVIVYYSECENFESDDCQFTAVFTDNCNEGKLKEMSCSEEGVLESEIYCEMGCAPAACA